MTVVEIQVRTVQGVSDLDLEDILGSRAQCLICSKGTAIDLAHRPDVVPERRWSVFWSPNYIAIVVVIRLPGDRDAARAVHGARLHLNDCHDRFFSWKYSGISPAPPPVPTGTDTTLCCSSGGDPDHQNKR